MNIYILRTEAAVVFRTVTLNIIILNRMTTTVYPTYFHHNLKTKHVQMHIFSQQFTYYTSISIQYIYFYTNCTDGVGGCKNSSTK